MVRVGSSFDSALNLKATELRLALPGSDEPDKQTSTSSSSVASRKRSIHDLEDDSVPPSKAQVVGWPPVKSCWKNSFRGEKQVKGSGLYVKVNMDGAPFLRKIDLKAYTSYVELVDAMEGMFKVKIGEYLESEGYGECGYVPSYEDKDGDWMLIGDVPWEMFVSSCKRLRIMKSEDKQLNLYI
ncbi:hypothetical protein V2J09_012663 [Rumex salicifolius]